jgi:hypothetical protein
MWSSSSPVRIRTRLPWRSVAHSGVTSVPSAADSQANRAPDRPWAAASSRAGPSRRIRYSSIALAAAGSTAASTGDTNTSASQNTWPA